MERDAAPDDLFLGLVRGPVVGPFGGMSVEVWLRNAEPVAAVLAGGDPEDLAGLHRIAWSLGCTAALAVQRGRAVLIETADPPGRSVVPRVLRRIDPVPLPVPGVVRVLASLAGTWRERLLRRCLAGHRDWSEADLNRAVEAPIAGRLLGVQGGVAAGRMRAELDAAGVVLGAVPPGLLALAWDLHLTRGVRLAGADASLADRPPADRAGPDRSVLRQFAAWACTDAAGAGRVLVPACGAGRLLLAIGDWAAANGVRVFALDPDPRAVLFARALVEREYKGRLDCTVAAAHPLVETDLDDDPLARLVPPDARARLRAADWTTLFGGVDLFDRVLVADPAVPLTRRTAVQRYVQGRYASAGTGTDPALLLVEAGARRLSPGGRVIALYPVADYRAPSAAAFRRWLAPRADALVAAPGYCAARAAPDPVATPISAGRFADGGVELRPYPRSALDPAAWTFTDPAHAALVARLESGAAALGEILLGGVRAPAPFTPDPALLIDARDRRRLVRADRRAVRSIRPVIGPGDVTRFGSVRTAPRFVVTGPLPPRARRLARDLGLEPPGGAPLPPPAGPRLLFAEGAARPAFLCDSSGRAVPTAGVGTIAPADAFLAGLLHSSPVAVLVAERCPGGLSARCLARLAVRIPDPYDECERRAGDEIGAFARERISLAGREGARAARRRRELEVAIDRAVERLYEIPSP